MGLFGSSDEPSEQVKELVENAEDKSVTIKRLTKQKTGFGRGHDILSEKTLVDFLKDNEQPEYIFPYAGMNAEVRVENGENIQPNGKYRVLFTITDYRILFVVGDKDKGDWSHEIPYSKVISADLYDIEEVKATDISYGKLNPAVNDWVYEIITEDNKYLFTADYHKVSDQRLKNALDYLLQKAGLEKVLDEDFDSVSEELSDTKNESLTDLSDDDSMMEGLPDAASESEDDIHEKSEAKSEKSDRSDDSKFGADSEDTTDGKEVSEGVINESSAEPDSFEKIEKLSELHEQGILTSEEFEEKKIELLDQL